MKDKNVKKPYLIAIAGPSGSGKTEICRYLKREFGGTLCLSLDDYFRNPEELPKIGEWKNSDVPIAIRFDLLAGHIELLRNNQSVKISVFKYPHKSWERVEKLVQPEPLIVIDGFLALYDKRLRDLCDLKIFIDIPEDLQFQRRTGRDKEHDREYIKKVVIPSYRRYGLPSKQFANYIIDGSKLLREVKTDARDIVKNYLNI